MPDLPDYRAWVEAVYLLAASLAHGGIAVRPADPDDGDVYLATDTEKLYVCYADGVWTEVTVAALLLAGGTMSGAIAMGTNKITGLGDPTGAQDAATRAYTLAQIVVHAALTATHGVATIAGLADIVAHAAVTTAVHGVGASVVASIANIATHAALTATHGVAGIIAGLADIVSYIATHTANASAHHTKYTDAEAKAAAVQAGAITDGVTKAPTHDAVYDVKVTADAALPAAQKGAASGVASLDASTKVVENPANATATPTASKIPIADGSGKLDGWVTAAGLSSKVITGTREMTAASGNVSRTGVGFPPKVMICLGVINNTNFACIGFCNSALANYVLIAGTEGAAGVWAYCPDLIWLSPAAGAHQCALVASMDADGFTETWTKVGSPTGTANLIYLCLA